MLKKENGNKNDQKKNPALKQASETQTDQNETNSATEYPERENDKLDIRGPQRDTKVGKKKTKMLHKKQQ